MKNFRHFSSQYILIEDSKGKHQPIYKEYEKSPPKMTVVEKIGCPFVTKKVRRENKNKNNSKKKPKSGYCEVCCMRYSSYLEHMKQEHVTCECASLDEFVREFKEVVIETTSIDYENSPSTNMRSVYYLSSYE
ncbi:hypothetical protein EHP00_1290 [Ecytonucleospora hepatopenaei]|uniref:DBF4-type domain-containing protein n=1 Tax=Ecytonucleospora hepatopenaei TaxID=646526 RepID=A0A1W0E6S1_9MICR|nr:hypothetical protein EHP00_1290 [Ecytonucleospora hepatopenaei]